MEEKDPNITPVPQPQAPEKEAPVAEFEKVEEDITQRKPLDRGSWRQIEPRGKIHAYNWLANVPGGDDCDLVQVQFKNTRYGFYANTSHLDLKVGDMVVVEASPGHDVGEVTMTGKLVALQLERQRGRKEPEIRKIYRKARPADIEKYDEARAKEHDTMIRSRQIAESLELKMKIGDVEYQGDGGKAIFYYIADERVDFRKLIRILADTFKVRIEMKQIGARQEAGRIGGIGPCGRPLCCASWMNRFVSVGTAAARYQDLSMNPQKLAGQCAKLKCCLNYEVDTYVEAGKKIPSKDVILETIDGQWYYFKSDILAGTVSYSTAKNMAANLVTIPAARAFEVIAMNKKGEKPDSLVEEGNKPVKKTEFVELVGQDDLTRFDKAKKKKKKKKNGGNNNNNNRQQRQPQKEKPGNEKGGKERREPHQHRNERRQ